MVLCTKLDNNPERGAVQGLLQPSKWQRGRAKQSRSLVQTLCCLAATSSSLGGQAGQALLMLWRLLLLLPASLMRGPKQVPTALTTLLAGQAPVEMAGLM